MSPLTIRQQVAASGTFSPPPPVPPDPPTYLGLATDPALGYQGWRDFTATYGRPTHRRSYDTGAPAWINHIGHYDQLTPPNGTGASVSIPSIKPNVANTLSGALDSYFDQLALDLPDGTIVSIWHEPENDFVAANGLSQADYKAVQARAIPRMRAVRPNLKFACILTIGAFEGGKIGTSWIPFDGSGDPYVDMVCVDVYNGFGVGTRPWKSFQERVEPTFLAQMVPTGIPYGATEVGTRADPADLTRRATWITQGWTYAKQANFTNWCYWSQGDYVLTGDANTLAAWTSVVNSPWTP